VTTPRRVRLPFNSAEVDTRAEFKAAFRPFAVLVPLGARKHAEAAAFLQLIHRMSAAAGAYRAKHGAWPHPTKPLVVEGREIVARPCDWLSMRRWAVIVEVLAGIDPATDRKPGRRAAR